MEKFTIGLLLGAVGGALLAANSCKMRTLVRKGQEEVKQEEQTAEPAQGERRRRVFLGQLRKLGRFAKRKGRGLG